MDFTVFVDGVEWLLRITRLRGSAWGWCCYGENKILVDSATAGEHRLEIVIHELLHAHFQGLTEEEVASSAAEIAAALWTLGYRVAESGDPV